MEYAKSFIVLELITDYQLPNTVSSDFGLPSDYKKIIPIFARIKFKKAKSQKLIANC